MLNFLRSTSVRIALGYATLVIFSALALVGIQWWHTVRYLDREIADVIMADTRAIGDRLRDLGLKGAEETVEERVKQTADERGVYLLVDPMRNVLAGNLHSWPAQVGTKPGWYDVSLPQDRTANATRILSVVLPGGYHLLVGRDVQSGMVLRNLMVDGLGWSALATVIFAVGGGLLVRHTVLKRVVAINETANAIVSGDLSRRMLVFSPGDEFDQLARTINGMLDQIQLLIEGARNTSDAVAHDLRTPLAELRARLELIVQERPVLDATIAEVQKAVADTDRLIAIFNALLRLADIKSGVRRSAFRDVDLADIVSNVGEFYAPMAEERGTTLKIHAQHGLVVYGDPHLLAQALANLVDNAIKFTACDGDISLRLCRNGSDQVELSVADNGPGIPDSEKRLVLEKFHRGADHRETAGYGLGLSLVQAIMRIHGGTLVLSDNSPGLVASLVLPSQNRQKSQRKPPPKHATVS